VSRLHQAILISSTILGSWLGMQAIHEAGHVLGSCLTGGQVTRVVLYPLTISRTDLSDNPHPLAVVWAGPIVGSLAPLLLWVIAKHARLPGAFVLRFFAGFCLIANGSYIGVGSLNHVGDCGVMLQNGSEMWQLWLFGALTAPIGLVLWHGQGPQFGLGVGRGSVRRDVTYGSLVVCMILLIIGFAVDGQ
jgi:Peptidase M50B-like